MPNTNNVMPVDFWLEKGDFSGIYFDDFGAADCRIFGHHQGCLSAS